jgi:hypothetical protein
VIGYSVLPAPGGGDLNATALAAKNWSRDPDLGTPLNGWRPASLFRAALAPLDPPVAPVAPVCATGNCTYPQFSSVGVCVAMANITSHLKITKRSPPRPDDWNLVYPNMFPNATSDYLAFLAPECLIAAPDAVTWRTCSLNTSRSFAFASDTARMSTRIFSMPVIYSMPENDAIESYHTRLPNSAVRFYALEVFFHLCVNTYTAEVKNGVARTQVTSSSWEQIPPGKSPLVDVNCTIPMLNYPSFYECTLGVEGEGRNGTTSVPLKAPETPNSANPEDWYFSDVMTLHALVVSMSRVVVGFSTLVPEANGEGTYQMDSNFGAARVGEAIYNHVERKPELQYAGISAYAQNIATSINNM